MTEALRAAIDRTLSEAGRQARAGSEAISRERATQLLDEVARRGRDAGSELARRGAGARRGLGRRGQEAGDELVQRLESLERRLDAIEATLRARSEADPEAED